MPIHSRIYQYLCDLDLLKGITPSNLNYNFGLIDKYFGFGKHNVHSTRKYFITQLITKGAPLPIVAKLVGHSTKSITIDIYCKPNISELQKVVELL